MADIDLRHDHSLGRDEVRAAVEDVARQLSEDFGVEYRWEQATLRFDGQGAEGSIEIQEGAVNVRIDLSFFLKPMRGQVESEAKRYLDEHLTP